MEVVTQVLIQKIIMELGSGPGFSDGDLEGGYDLDGDGDLEGNPDADSEQNNGEWGGEEEDADIGAGGW